MEDVDVKEVHARLKRWLVEAAYPLWWSRGADHVRGGFHERLRSDAAPSDLPRRARLHPRQISAFSNATELGWAGPGDVAVAHALKYFETHYLRSDGLYRTLVAADGATLDDSAVLYDQAFALLGFARAHVCLDDDQPRDAALTLLSQLHSQLKHPEAGFRESTPADSMLLANSHMHLLEAALSWMSVDPTPAWAVLAEEIVGLALRRFIDPHSGFVLEFFSADWQPARAERGARIEPGHQFEWGSLLLEWSGATRNERTRATALDLIAHAERACVDPSRDAAIDGMLSDGTVTDANARLWPQAERLRAGCLASAASGDTGFLRNAARAGQTLLRYLETPVHGLWYDSMDVTGRCRDEDSPASSFYHLVTAIVALDRVLADSRGPC